MKKAAFLIILLFGTFLVLGQDIYLTFAGIGESTEVDSVTATNLETGESITFAGNAILVLSQGTGIQDQVVDSDDLTVYPNPFSGETRLVANIQKSQQVEVSIFNLVGQLIAQNNEFVTAGQQQFSVRIADPGIYIISLQTDQGTASRQMVCTETVNNENSIIYVGEDGSNTMKSVIIQSDNSQPEYVFMGFTLGDTLAYTGYGSIYTTTITDAPEFSQEYEIEFVDCTDPDSKTYPVVKIGDQFWMAENLAYLPNVSGKNEGSVDSPHYYVYDYDGNSVEEAKGTENYSVYGVLYNWDAAVVSCPSGWHLPKRYEWLRLIDSLGFEAGAKLKSTQLWFSPSHAEGNSNNKSQFNALPAGYFSCNFCSNSGFNDIQWRTTFWSNYNYYIKTAMGVQLRYSERQNEIDVWRNSANGNLGWGFSVRCIRNVARVGNTKLRNITESSAIGSGEIQYFLDVSEILSCGFCWSEKTNPTIADNKTVQGFSDVYYTSCISGLKSRGKYYVRAYFSTISGETYYGDQLVFKTVDGSFMDNRDSTVYGYASIGNQTWMTKNLAHLPSLGRSENDCYYLVDLYKGDGINEAKEHENYKNYGVLYNGEASQNACPEGWHLPLIEEWDILSEYLGENAGVKMKSISGWRMEYFSGNGDNSSNFNALPGGCDDYFTRNQGEETHFWTASPESWPAMVEKLTHLSNTLVREIPGLGMDFASIRCLKNKPMVLTSEITKNYGSCALGGGEVFYYGNPSEIISRGVCWSTKENPSLSDFVTEEAHGIGEYTSKLEYLEPNTIYYVRAYFNTSVGDTIYGNEKKFTTSDGFFMDNRDSVLYGYVEIGQQTWMAENLAYLPTIDSLGFSNEEPLYYVYDYHGNSLIEATKTNNYTQFGALYNFKAAENACPEGWHLPSDEEWQVLEAYLGMDSIELYVEGHRESGNVGEKLKSSYLWLSYNGEDSLSFSALPSGLIYSIHFSDLYWGAYYWTSSKTDINNAWGRSVNSKCEGVGGPSWCTHYKGLNRYPREMSQALSVRCIRNQ